MNRKTVVSRSREEALDAATPGDIVLFHHARGLSRVITLFSGSSYYHVALYAGGPFVIESRVRGVKKRDVTQANVRLQFSIIPAPGGPEKGQKALDWALGQIGERYAYFSIGALILDRTMQRLFGPMDIVWHQSNRVSCGELVAEAFKVAGKNLFPGKDADEIAPWDFARLSRERKSG